MSFKGTWNQGCLTCVFKKGHHNFWAKVGNFGHCAVVRMLRVTPLSKGQSPSNNNKRR